MASSAGPHFVPGIPEGNFYSGKRHFQVELFLLVSFKSHGKLLNKCWNIFKVSCRSGWKAEVSQTCIRQWRNCMLFWRLPKCFSWSLVVKYNGMQYFSKRLDIFSIHFYHWIWNVNHVIPQYFMLLGSYDCYHQLQNWRCTSLFNVEYVFQWTASYGI